VQGDINSLSVRRRKKPLVRRGAEVADLAHWADVAKVVNDRMAERGITQRELAERSGVSVATLRKIQGGGEQQRTRATLANVSRALGLPDDYLSRVSQGDKPAASGSDKELSAVRAELADLARRVEALESRLTATAVR
jgi:transcriptional regulator with XRE-family HTH domain